MRKIITSNSQIEFQEVSSTGTLLNSIGLQLGEVYFIIKGNKVSFYLNDSEKPFDSFIWSIDIPFYLDDELIETPNDASAALKAIMNDSFQEQLDALQEELATEEGRAQAAEEALQTAIENETSRATSAETNLQGEITSMSGTVATLDTLISGLTDDLASEIARATNAEDVLDSKIDLEIQNRINAVSGLTERVADDEASTGAALVDLNNKINAVSGENASQNVQISGLTNSINTEISRATSVENALRSDITNETSARTTADAAQLQRITALEVGKADANNVYTKLESDNKYATKDYISGLTDEFQVKLVAGENITISGNVISAVGGGGGVTPSEVQEMIDESISGKADSDDVYTKNEVYTKSEVDEAIDNIDLSDFYTKSEVDASQLAQDNKINAISGDVQTLNEKVDTISGESVTSGEVQTQIDNSISGKADKTDIYTYVGTDRITVSNTTGTRRKAIDLNLPIYKGSGMLSISCNNMQGTSEGNNNIQGMTSFGAGFDVRTFNSFEAAFGTSNKTAGNSSVFEGLSGNTLFTVGNGKTNVKHNAFEIRQNGDIYIANTNDTSTTNYYDKPMIKLQDALGGGGGVTPSEVQTMIDNSLDGYQEELTAGAGIDITNNVISVTGGSQPVDAYTKAESDAKFATITNFNTHSGNTNIHVTAAEKSTWNNKSDFSGSYNDLTNKPTIPNYTAGSGITISNNVISAKIWQGTKAQYEAITTKDADTIYLIYNS